jgi:hypothetical protein
VSRHGSGCRHLYLSCAWVVNTLLVASCGTSDDELVAQVGTYRITVRQYRSYVEGLPGRWQPDKTGDESRLHHLQVLIDRCLLLMEGESLGLDTLAAVRQAAEKAVDEYVVARYQLDWMQSQPDISEQEIESVFHSEGFDRERLGLAVRVRTRYWPSCVPVYPSTKSRGRGRWIVTHWRVDSAFWTGTRPPASASRRHCSSRCP